MESKFWALAPQAKAAGVSNSVMGKLAKLCSDYERAYRILSSAIKTKYARAYVGKVISTIKEEQAPIQISTPRTHEPEIVLQARLHGWPVRKTVRTDGSPGWYVAGFLYDHTGDCVGR